MHQEEDMIPIMIPQQNSEYIENILLYLLVFMLLAVLRLYDVPVQIFTYI